VRVDGQQNDPVEFPEDMNPEARDLISKLLCKQAAERISLEEVKLHPFLNGRGGVAFSPLPRHLIETTAADMENAITEIPSLGSECTGLSCCGVVLWCRAVSCRAVLSCCVLSCCELSCCPVVLCAVVLCAVVRSRR
jgi:hypothetical protein